jgi:RNA polymerase sigma-70 factor (ECF subfamily)
VAPGTTEIRVTFSKEMTDQSWSWSTAWQNSTPEVVGKPQYDSDRRTCTLKVKLEPGKTYGYWINSPKFSGFKDAQGHTAIPYLFVFQTRQK